MPKVTANACLTLFLSCFLYIFSNAQSHRDVVTDILGFQWGFSIKAVAEFSLKENTQTPVFRLCANFGIASEFLTTSLYPSINAEVQVYNGGFGSMRRNGDKTSGLSMDLITAFTFTSGFYNRFTSTKESAEQVQKRMMPLYYFADFVNPALQNPYDYSLSIGTNVILSTDRNRTAQRVGFLNVHLASTQFSYYNDGGSPFKQLHLGDNKDRYYTGGGIVSYDGKHDNWINRVELSFHKFTGFTRNAFEVSNRLDLAYVDYYRSNQKYYNKSMWSLNISNPVKGFGVNFKRYNYTNWDIQHLIHWSSFQSYHLVPYDDFFAVSGAYFLGYTNIGIRYE